MVEKAVRNKKKRRYRIFVIILVGILLIGLNMPLKENKVLKSAILQDKEIFVGEGSVKSPYLISNYEDLCKLRDLCNKGNSFAGIYFKQTHNIKMPDLNWKPIGYQNEFSGIYNGDGYSIYNLNAENKYTSGLFGRLSGVVANLGIENGRIKGENCGSVSGLICSENALIINCYSKATLEGENIGGIAGYAQSNGTIACIYDATNLNGKKAGGIIGVGGYSKIYSCFSENTVISADGCKTAISNTGYKFSDISKKIYIILNIEQGLAQYLFSEKYHIPLKQITFLSEKGICFSDSNFWIFLCGVINSYLLPIALAIISFFYIVKLCKLRKNDYWNAEKHTIKTITFLFLLISIFVDFSLKKIYNILMLVKYCL